MFKKLVSNLPFSPALVGQLGFYARRLKREETTRRLGLVFTALALVLQSFAVFSPPEPANAANPSDIIYGGIKNKAALLSAYDASARGNGDIKKIYDYIGITRAEIAAAKEGTLNSISKGRSDGAWLSWGRSHRFSASHGEVKHNANGSTIYSRPLWRFDSTSYTKRAGSTYKVLIGHSAKVGQFAIIKDCANPVTTKLPTPPTPPPPPAPLKESRCVMLQAKRIERTKFTLNATAEALHGASISRYDFTVKDAKGKIVTKKSVSSKSTKASSNVIELPRDGTYTASVLVKTSVGDKQSPNCVTALTVIPPEKCPLNPNLTVEDKDCQPCPDNPDIWYKSEDCKPKVASGKEATNLTQGHTKADTVTANAGDRIEYEVTLYNVGKIPAKADFKEELADVMEYATLQDNGGASYDDESKVLSWGEVNLKPGEKETRTFVVALMNEIPATPRGTSDPSSYDCVMTNAFGDTINIDVNCTTPKIVEQIVGELPSTGPTENIIFAGTVGALVTYFWARSRQLGREVRLIRKEFNMGTI